MKLFPHYRLALANGQVWGMTSHDEESEAWLAKFASIMQLRRRVLVDAPRIVFARRKDSGPVDALSALHGRFPLPIASSGNGWTARESRVARWWFHSQAKDILCEIDPSTLSDGGFIAMWQALFPVNVGVVEKGGVSIHAAAIVRDGKGILLGAPGETGKSTCCRRLPPPWKALCDDEAVIVMNQRMSYRVHPLPTWSNYILKRSQPTYTVEKSVPLAGIMFIEQSASDKILRLGRGRSVPCLYRLAMEVYYVTSWRYLEQGERERLRANVLSNCADILQKVPTFILSVSMDGRFWERIEEVLFNGHG